MSHPNRDTDRHCSRTNATHRSAADPSDAEPVSRAVVEAVAASEDVDPTELPVLAEFVDADALDGLFEHWFDGDRRGADGRVEFEYDDYLVTVTTDGTIAVRPVPTDE